MASKKIPGGNLELARRIRAAGIRICIREDDCEAPSDLREGLLITQDGGPLDSFAADGRGGTLFVIWIRITINLPRFAISQFALELPWDDTVQWLQDPRETDHCSNFYLLGGSGPPFEYERRDVLNHYADRRRTWRRGDSLQGCLLGAGLKSIPDEFRHGMAIPALVSITDQYMKEYSLAVELRADRSYKIDRLARPRAKRERLFDRLEPQSPRVS